MEQASQLIGFWPILIGIITLIIILAKMHSDTDVLKEKVKVLFDLFNSMKDKQK
tara:strand:- start:1233 stop:1394 length:162 start_codon:yes stop_codon:yes gene_type:complete